MKRSYPSGQRAEVPLFDGCRTTLGDTQLGTWDPALARSSAFGSLSEPEVLAPCERTDAQSISPALPKLKGDAVMCAYRYLTIEDIQESARVGLVHEFSDLTRSKKPRFGGLLG